MSLVSHKTHFLKVGYATAIGFVIYFLAVPKAITGAICGGNYIVFNTSNDLYRLFGFYYWGFLLLGIWESSRQNGDYQATDSDEECPSVVDHRLLVVYGSDGRRLHSFPRDSERRRFNHVRICSVSCSHPCSEDHACL